LYFIYRYDKSVAKLRAGGCEDEDILQLMELFSEKAEEVGKVFMELAMPKSQISTTAGKRDIGRSPRSQGKDAEELVLRMSDLTQFINKVEDIADSELDTLRTYILKNTSERS
jgi:pyocin large subunit-like protein